MINSLIIWIVERSRRVKRLWKYVQLHCAMLLLFMSNHQNLKSWLNFDLKILFFKIWCQKVSWNLNVVKELASLEMSFITKDAPKHKLLILHINIVRNVQICCISFYRCKKITHQHFNTCIHHHHLHHHHNLVLMHCIVTTWSWVDTTYRSRPQKPPHTPP